jgi:hypothetical protein
VDPPAGDVVSSQLLTVNLFPGGDLTEANGSLSATRLSGMAAAILEIFQLEPIVAQQQPHFSGPGLRTGQVGKKGPETGAGSLFLTHGRYSCLLTLGVNVPSGMGDDVQFHAIVQLFLGGVFDILYSVQGAQPFVAGAIFHLHKPFTAFR